MDKTEKWLCMLLVVLLLGGCSAASWKEVEEQSVQYWPALPERPRFVHEATIRGGADVYIESEELQLKNLLTGREKYGQRMLKPHSVAVKNGRIYVTDTQIKQVHAFDLVRRRHFPIGYRFEGKLTRPRGVAVDDNGLLYVVDDALKNKRLVIYDRYGLYISSIDLDDISTRPTGVEVSPDGKRIFVIDTGGVSTSKHSVLEFNADGELVAAIGTRGDGEGDFNLPVDAAYSDDGYLYVLDAGNFRVQVFKDGKFVRSWGQVGRNLGDLARPRAITLDNQGHVYVSDALYTNVQIFDAEGRLLLPVGKRGYEDRNGTLALVSGIEVDETGRLYVVDQMFDKVEIYRPISEQEGKRLQREYKE